MAYVRNRLLTVSAYEENGTTMSPAGQGAPRRAKVDSLGGARTSTVSAHGPERTLADRSIVIQSAYAKCLHRAGCSQVTDTRPSADHICHRYQIGQRRAGPL